MSSSLTPRAGLGETLHGTLFSPLATFSASPPRLRQAVAVTAFVAAVSTLVIGFTGLAGLWLGFAALWGALLLGWALVGGAATLLARAFAPRGEIRPMLAGLGLAFLPLAFAAPLTVVSGWGSLAGVLAAVGMLGLVAWSFAVATAAIRAQTGLSPARALLAVVVAFLAVAALPGTLFGLTALGVIAAIV